MYKFERLALQLRKLIEQGFWQPQQRLPSLREQAQHSGYSLMTVMNAYQELEAQGLIYANEKSGYFVCEQIIPTQLSSSPLPEIKSEVEVNSMLFQYLKATQNENLIGFGSAFPEQALLHHPKLMQILAQHARHKQSYSSLDSMPPGHLPLQHLIARRYQLQGIDAHANDIVITSGCLDALNLSLQAVAKAGDYILLQETIFYGAWQAAERLGLKVITLPEHPLEGFDLDLFEQCLKNYPIKVCWLMLNAHNPIGFTVNNKIKAQIAQLLAQYQVHLIEDDVYQELYHGVHKPLTVKHFDREQWVLHCSSFSKTLGAGFRVGWVNSAKFSDKIQHLQLMSTISVSPLLQHALTEFIATHHYEKHLKILRQQLERRKKEYYSYLKANLPKVCEVYYYPHGYFLWVKLPQSLDGMSLYRASLEQHISIAPAKLFSMNQQQQNFIRINCSFEWSSSIENTLAVLIDLIDQNK